jgi:hypothetical protein
MSGNRSTNVRLVSWLIGIWFVGSLVASGLHVYLTGPGQPPLFLGLAAAAPILVFVAWCVLSPSFRQFILTVNPRVLTLIQTWRVAGFSFVVLASFGLLPRMFALSAGWGDIFIGITAGFVALNLATPNHRRIFITWQVLGMIDLVNAVAMGTLSGVLDPHGIPTTPMTILPLSMIPTFAVPLFLIFHIICIAQAVRWPAERAGIAPEQRFQAAI